MFFSLADFCYNYYPAYKTMTCVQTLIEGFLVYDELSLLFKARFHKCKINFNLNLTYYLSFFF